jgi:prepilin-type N-terminal cleavage/methylation domain-containing protein
MIAFTFAINILQRLRRAQQPLLQTRQTGFTLLELLIVAVIGGGLISGLMFIAIELLGADRRESALTETQREMQLASNYISDELREAVYVYTGTGLDNLIDRAQLGFLEGNGKTPVLAFWKQEPFPEQVRNNCGRQGLDSCYNAHSYALVIYSLQQDTDPNDEWQGKARITRYAITEYPQTGTTPNAGYVNPANHRNNFATWPVADPPPNPPYSPPVNRAPVVLVDYVATERLEPFEQDPGNALCPNPPDNPATVDIDESKSYEISPTADQLRTFYACISTISSAGSSVQADVILFLQGDASGRPGIGGVALRNSILPALETRVLSRGVLDRS